MRMGTRNIGEGIIMDILIRLPVKSLLRFRCVSEFWNTLISESYFKKKHLNFHAKNENSQKLLIGQSINNSSFYFHCSFLSSVQIVKDIQRLEWPLSPEQLLCKVYCSCDGLFFIGIWPSKPMEEPIIFLLWNPSTRESIILPHLECPKEGCAYGLGYDSISDDYKLVKIDIDEQVDEILALKSGSWKKIHETSDRMHDNMIFERECLAFVHGAFHWYGWSGRRVVVSLNISNEKYGEIPLPEIVWPPLSKSELVVSVLGGMLCVYLNDRITFNLWLMKDYGVKESWTKLFSIPINGENPILLYRFSNGEVLLSDMKYSGRDVYRTSDGSFGLSNRIWPSNSDDDFDGVMTNIGFVYTESLIKPKLGH